MWGVEATRECEGKREREREAGEYHGSRVGAIWKPDISAADAVVTSKTYYVTKPRRARNRNNSRATRRCSPECAPSNAARAVFWHVARATWPVCLRDFECHRSIDEIPFAAPVGTLS